MPLGTPPYHTLVTVGAYTDCRPVYCTDCRLVCCTDCCIQQAVCSGLAKFKVEACNSVAKVQATAQRTSRTPPVSLTLVTFTRVLINSSVSALVSEVSVSQVTPLSSEDTERKVLDHLLIVVCSHHVACRPSQNVLPPLQLKLHK